MRNTDRQDKITLPESTEEKRKIAGVSIFISKERSITEEMETREHRPTNARVASSSKLRRLTDVVVSASALLVLSPFLVLLTLVTPFASGFPIFYSQTRVGRDGKLFRIWKFRTMKRRSEPYGPQLSHRDDPRVTSYGRILRRFHLDELPQFWNVLKGDMTIVGYRPERPFYVAKILQRYPDYSTLLTTKPGLISIGVLDYGYASTIDGLIERAFMDIAYLSNRKGIEDLKLIGKTFIAVSRGRGI